MTLALAMLLDALFGEPRAIWDRIPHPAVLMGRAIAWAETRLNTGQARRAKGIGLIVGLVAVAGLGGAAIAAVPGLGPVATVLLGAVLLAQRSLVDHVRAVADGLRYGVGEGRHAVSMIVGRDTANMTEAEVARAAIESAAENLSDGVIAPVFWFALLGLPGLLIYKVVNTADSMIGHKTERFQDFGWAAARLDDLLNLIPARASAVLIAVATGTPAALRIAVRDAPLHRSPNAGWPEGAMAGALDIALSGPRSYHGTHTELPWVHPDGRRDLGPADIDRACAILWRAWGLCFVGAVLWAAL